MKKLLLILLCLPLLFTTCKKEEDNTENPSNKTYVPDDVFDDIFSYWPNTDVDACTGETSIINDFWSWYEFDMRVDAEGNPHIVISIIAESDLNFHFFPFGLQLVFQL